MEQLFMLRTIICIFLFASFFTFTEFAYSQENKGKERVNYDKISDDIKFKNASRFFKLMRYHKALEELNEYLEIYVDGNHRPEAYKFLAKIYFNQFDYQRAIKLYRALYEEYSNTEEGVGALYSAGICYAKMGYNKKAIKVFRDIINEHSDSNYAVNSQVQIDLLKILK